mmetsp:Transcript_100860/g.181994  ORF Transcript_100860/g.181994 Transcript_100860/m.181994 type:complete len:251 (+) Transcript_100860:992-1744(+)
MRFTLPNRRDSRMTPFSTFRSCSLLDHSPRKSRAAQSPAEPKELLSVLPPMLKAFSSRSLSSSEKSWKSFCRTILRRCNLVFFTRLFLLSSTVLFSFFIPEQPMLSFVEESLASEVAKAEKAPAVGLVLPLIRRPRITARRGLEGDREGDRTSSSCLVDDSPEVRLATVPRRPLFVLTDSSSDEPPRESCGSGVLACISNSARLAARALEARPHSRPQSRRCRAISRASCLTRIIFCCKSSPRQLATSYG